MHMNTVTKREEKGVNMSKSFIYHAGDNPPHSLPASFYGGLKAQQMSEQRGRDEAAVKIEIVREAHLTVKSSMKSGSEVQT